MSHIVVFAGPTLSKEDIHAIVPDVEVRPPISAGDLLRLPFAPGDLVAIIDGFYFQSGAVRHKEILSLLQRGVHVWGAASMGALRAAELATFGMRGVGRIFQSYLQGDIEGDDEVAILHSSEEMGNIHLAEALVNIRYACTCAQEEGLLSVDERKLILACAATLPFFERSYPAILMHAQERGLPEQSSRRFEQFVREQSPDLKRLDALELIEALRTPPQGPFSAPFKLNETTFVRDWDIFSKGTVIDEQLIVPDVDLLTIYQLFGTDYPELHRAVLLKALAELARRDVKNDSSEKSDDEGIVARYIADQLNVGVYDELPAELCRWLSPAEQHLSHTHRLIILGLRVWQEPRSQSWYKSIIDSLKKSDLFYPLLKLAAQARLFNETLQEKHQSLELQHLSPLHIYEWVLKRWCVEAKDMQFTLLDRGFQGTTDLLERGRPFYLFDKYVGVPELTESVR